MAFYIETKIIEKLKKNIKHIDQPSYYSRKILMPHRLYEICIQSIASRQNPRH